MAKSDVESSGARVGRRSPGRGALAGAGLWLGSAWLACGGASREGLESPLPSVSLSSAGASGTPDAGVEPDAGSEPNVLSPSDAGGAEAADCRGAPCSECPQPVSDSPDNLGPTTAWGRNPETGTCCPYADQLFVPQLFPAFESLEACEGSCRCAELVGASGVPEEELSSWVTERISLECYCSEKACPASLEAVVEERCDVGATLHRSQGCGLRKLEQVSENGVVAEWVFEEASGSLVGASDGSDVPGFPCRSYETRAGTDFDCPEAERCRVCGELERDPDETTPSCD
jgi:hypothetical protein